jgi:hypothetical protein
MRRTIALLTVVGLMVPLAAHALNENVWLMLNGVGGRYDMSELNDELAAFNAANAGSAMIFPMIKKGISYGGSVGVETAGRWNFGLGLDRLHAISRASDPNGAVDYDFSANAWRAFAEYAIRPMGHSSLFLGGAVGVVSESGKITESMPFQLPQAYKLDGGAPLYEAHAGGNWWASPRFALVAAAGYRYARIKTVKIEGGTLITSNGETLAVDYSGPYVRLGFKLAGRTGDQ